MQKVNAVSFMLGASHGLFLAEGAAQKEKFCATAAEEKVKAGAAHSWE